MRIENESLLKSMRTPGPCEYCRRPCVSREAAHILACGMGSAHRLDIRINLLSLGRTEMFQCFCHGDHHRGLRPTKKDLLAVVSEREHTTPEAIETVVWLLRRLPKHPRLEVVYREYDGLAGVERKLAERVLVEAGIFG